MSATRDATKQDTDRASTRLLPLSTSPFQAPTDRDMLPSERSCRLADFVTVRRMVVRTASAVMAAEVRVSNIGVLSAEVTRRGSRPVTRPIQWRMSGHSMGDGPVPYSPGWTEGLAVSLLPARKFIGKLAGSAQTPATSRRAASTGPTTCPIRGHGALRAPSDSDRPHCRPVGTRKRFIARRGILSSCGDETWSRNEMGDPDNHFKAAETSGAEYPCPSGRSAILTYRLACRLDGRQQ